MKGDIITYDYYGSLYINMTNRCDCHCVFLHPGPGCLRPGGPVAPGGAHEGGCPGRDPGP